MFYSLSLATIMIFKKKIHELAWLIVLILGISACQESAETPTTSGVNKFSDPVIAKIYDLQDRRDTKSLLAFFDDENPEYRKESTLAFGSVQDTAAIRPLTLLLNDENTQVRKAAAYALGQMFDEQCIEPLHAALQTEDSVTVRKELIEALGKVITMPEIALLQNVTIDSEKEKEGLAWALYRSGIRNVHDGINLDIALALLDQNNTYETRLGAAHFFSRSPNLALAGREDRIVQAAATDPSPNVRMAATLGLRKAPTPKSREALSTTLVKDNDYRVRITTARALGSFNYTEVKEALMGLLEDENVNVSLTAAQLIANNEVEPELVERQENWRVKAVLMGGLTSDKALDLIKEEYANATNPYYKAELIRVLGNDLRAKDFVVQQLSEDSSNVIITAATEALVRMRRAKDFPASSAREFADLFKQIISQGDIAQVALISGLYLQPELDFRLIYNDYSFLHETKAKLSLPKDNEGLQVMNRVIAFFEGQKELPSTKNEFNHPVDWEKVNQIPKDQKVVIKTRKGNFTLRMFVEKAPGSVVNFLELAKEVYFNGKNFHRVVPNFVIQGGCNRGDGYGGEDYSIRSEFADLRYQEGSVGMASAGKDTEGTQWFVTHSPTPHLDGRYTIFAQVEDGMEVVHKVEVGDIIEEVIVLENDGL